MSLLDPNGSTYDLTGAHSIGMGYVERNMFGSSTEARPGRRASVQAIQVRRAEDQAEEVRGRILEAQSRLRYLITKTPGYDEARAQLGEAAWNKIVTDAEHVTLDAVKRQYADLARLMTLNDDDNIRAHLRDKRLFPSDLRVLLPRYAKVLADYSAVEALITSHPILRTFVQMRA